MSMARIALVILFLGATTVSAGETKLLLGFEKDEMPAGGLLWKGMDKNLVSDQVTQGKTAYCARHHDRWNSIAVGRKPSFYGMWRSGRVLRTLGWFKKVLPPDWSDCDLLRIDYRTDGPAVKVRLEVEDAFLSFPAAQVFDVPGNQWVTLEMDLGKAAKELRLDRKKMAHLLLMVTERPKGKAKFASFVDNLRLAKRSAAGKLKIIKSDTFLAPDAFKLAKRAELPGVDISKTTRATCELHSPISRKKAGGYPLLYVNERCIGGFGDGGILLAPDSGVRLSLDAGKTWQGLDGKQKPTRITKDHRGQHRSQTMILGTDVYMAYCTARCGGGGARVTGKFTKALRKGEKWVTGPESVVDQTARYCHDRFALCRAKSGRLWCAWSHLNRFHKKDIRAKWSQADGESWLQAGENARVGERGVFHYPGTPGNYEGPYMTVFGQEVACFWRRIPEGDTVWSRAVPLKAKVKEVKAGGKAVLPVGANQGVKIDCDVLLEKDGKVVSILTVVELVEGSCTAVTRPGSTGKIRAGDQVTVMTWSPAEVISKNRERQRTHSPHPHSVATSAGSIVYLGLTASRDGDPASRVLRYDAAARKWVEDSPPGLAGAPMLAAWNEKMACLWPGKEGIMLSVKSPGGKWSAARKIAAEQGGINTLAVPQVAPKKFLPVAWGTRSRKAIRVVAIPAGKD